MKTIKEDFDLSFTDYEREDYGNGFKARILVPATNKETQEKSLEPYTVVLGIMEKSLVKFDRDNFPSTNVKVSLVGDLSFSHDRASYDASALSHLDIDTRMLFNNMMSFLYGVVKEKKLGGLHFVAAGNRKALRKAYRFLAREIEVSKAFIQPSYLWANSKTGFDANQFYIVRKDLAKKVKDIGYTS